MVDHAKSKGRLLRDVFESEETALVPFGTSPIEALMAEKAGFSAFWISGAALSIEYGYADVGLLSMTEMVEHARRVARVTSLPVFSDADTGYGGAMNLWRTTQEFIRAGVAGIHIEDQREPKKAGGEPGKVLVSDAEAVNRLNAAVAARDELDPDFVIVARTDARGAIGGSFDEAVRRGQLYREETGGGVILCEGLANWDECREALAATPGLAFCNASSATAGVTPSTETLTAMGQRINFARVGSPLNLMYTYQLLEKVRETGQIEPVDRELERMKAEGFDRNVFLRVGFDTAREWEQRFQGTP